MATEKTYEIESSTLNSVWSNPSDIWVLINPDENAWTDTIDWSLGLLLRRTLLRFESKPVDLSVPLLLAAPEGLPTQKVLVLHKVKHDEGVCLAALAPVLEKLRVKSATVFAPAQWRKPKKSNIVNCDIRWVENDG